MDTTDKEKFISIMIEFMKHVMTWYGTTWRLKEEMNLQMGALYAPKRIQALLDETKEVLRTKGIFITQLGKNILINNEKAIQTKPKEQSYG